MTEEWRDVILNGENTEAQVSSFGRFRSVYGVVSKPLPTKSGYVYVKVNKKNYNIHRLIAIAFELPKEEGQDTVDHIDNDPTNNHLHNLRWATKSEQIRHSYATNKERKSSANRQSKPVRGRKIGSEEWVSYDSAPDAARALKLYQSAISACCNKKSKRAREYEFEFEAPNV